MTHSDLIAEIPQEEDPGYLIYALEQAVEDLAAFAEERPDGREGLAREGRRLILAQSKLYDLAYFLGLHKDAA